MLNNIRLEQDTPYTNYKIKKTIFLVHYLVHKQVKLKYARQQILLYKVTLHKELTFNVIKIIKLYRK